MSFLTSRGLIRARKILVSLFFAIAFGHSASGSLVLELNSTITGGTPASSTRPWLEAVFTSLGKDLNGNDQVELVLSAPNLTGIEDVDEWLFNIDPSFTQAQLNRLTIATASVEAGNFDLKNVTAVKEKVDGVTRAGFTFDFDIEFPNGSRTDNNKRFTGGDIVKLVMTMPGTPLSETSFDYLDSTGTYKSAAHIRNTTVGGSDSSWVGTAVPEPSTWIAGALLIAPLGLSALRIVRKRSRSA